MINREKERHSLEEDASAFKEYGRLAKNSQQEVVVSRRRLKVNGAWQDFLDIRVWYRPRSDEVERPGKGVMIRSVLGSRLAALVAAAAEEIMAREGVSRS